MINVNKKIIIHPCDNQEEILKIAAGYISGTINLKCSGNGYANILPIVTEKPFKKHGYVMETKVSIIFRGIIGDKNAKHE